MTGRHPELTRQLAHIMGVDGWAAEAAMDLPLGVLQEALGVPLEIVPLAVQNALVALTEATIAAVDAGARPEFIDKAVQTGRSIARGGRR